MGILSLFVAAVLSAGALPLYRPLYLTKIDAAVSPKAKCLDGSPPAYYFRSGRGDGTKRAILFMEGGSWCYPSEVVQNERTNCAYRAQMDSGLGSSKHYPQSIEFHNWICGTGCLNPASAPHCLSACNLAVSPPPASLSYTHFNAFAAWPRETHSARRGRHGRWPT